LKSHVVDGLMRMLQENEGTLRPPVQGARLLTFIVHRYKAGLPFPPRQEVAARYGISIPTIDAAISARIAEGYLTVRYDFVEGNVKGRSSSMRERYLIPHQSVLDLFEELNRKRPKGLR
jgi:hypothetical protein